MEGKNLFLCKEADELLRKRVDLVAKAYVAKYARKYIKEFVAENLSILLSESEFLTSSEVMRILKISRSTLNRRIKSGVLRPINPEADRNYRFVKKEVYNL